MRERMVGQAQVATFLVTVLVFLTAVPANVPAGATELPNHPGVREFKAGIEAAVHSATRSASNEAQEAIDRILKKAQKRLDKSVMAYLAEVDQMRKDALDQLFENIDCVSKSMVRDFAGVLESRLPLGSESTPVADFEKKWVDLHKGFSPSMSPHEIKTRYADFLVKARGVYCEVKYGEKAVLQQLDDILADGRASWATWHRVDGFCEDSSRCRDFFGDLLARKAAEGLSSEDLAGPRKLLSQRSNEGFGASELRLSALLRELDILSDLTESRRRKADNKLQAAVSKLRKAESELSTAEGKLGRRKTAARRYKRAQNLKERLGRVRDYCRQADSHLQSVKREAPLWPKGPEWSQYEVTCKNGRFELVEAVANSWIEEYEEIMKAMGPIRM